MKKILILFITFITSCSYQPLYTNKNLINFEFKKITIQGDKNIGYQILSSLPFKENNLSLNENVLLIESNYKIIETSKNSKGQVTTYKSQIVTKIVIKNNNEVIKSKNFDENFNYNHKDNNYNLIEYQNEIKDNLINKITENIFLYMQL